MKFVDLTLVEINATTLNFGSDTCQIKVGIVQDQKCSANIRCPTVITRSEVPPHNVTYLPDQRDPQGNKLVIYQLVTIISPCPAWLSVNNKDTILILGYN